MARQEAIRFLARRHVRVVLAGVVLLVIVAACAAFLLSQRQDSVTSEPSSGQSETVAKADASPTKPDATAGKSDSSSAPLADPSTLTSVAIEPLGVNVYYSKGTPGFEYEVKKTADGTQYVEFTSQELIGTKCTDDEGLFASIVQNPTSTEDQATVSQTVKVNNLTYGLSLAGPGCTSDASLLEQYQAGFKDGFTSLQAL